MHCRGLQRQVCARLQVDPAYVQMFPSSEVTPSLLAPGIHPSMLFEERDSGVLRPSRPRATSSRDAVAAAE